LTRATAGTITAQAIRPHLRSHEPNFFRHPSRPAICISAIISARSATGSRLQHDYECIFCIVDLHALTLPQNPDELRAATREVTAAYIAAGIDPERCIIFNQSMVSAHAELAWLLGCLNPARLAQPDDPVSRKKAGKQRENAGLGPLRLPGADGRRHLALQKRRMCRSARTRSSMSEARPRTSPAPSTAATNATSSRCRRPQIFGEATRVMSPARRHQEDVEIGHLGLFAHQT